jgi:hypothetical protein
MDNFSKEFHMTVRFIVGTILVTWLARGIADPTAIESLNVLGASTIGVVFLVFVFFNLVRPKQTKPTKVKEEAHRE